MGLRSLCMPRVLGSTFGVVSVCYKDAGLSVIGALKSKVCRDARRCAVRRSVVCITEAVWIGRGEVILAEQ